MSDIVAVLDGVIVKAATVPGIVGASDGGLMEIPSTPFALAYLNPGTTTQSTFTDYADEIEVRVYAPKSGLPSAYRSLLVFPDRFELVWRTGRSLGGTCLDSRYSGHGKVDQEHWNGVDYLFIPIRIGIMRAAAADLSP